MHHYKDENKVNNLLCLLARITSSKALLPFKRQDTLQVKWAGVYISNEHPEITYRRVINGYAKNYIPENHQKQKISNAVDFESEVGVTSKETNNIDIQKELEIFKPKLHKIIIKNYLLRYPSISECLPTQPPAYNQINFQELKMFFPLLEMTVEKIFEFLEKRRYYPDKPSQFLSGLHDTSHAIYAAYCDVFVTNDNKLKKKAAATYDWLGINTLILSPNEFVDYLANQSSNLIQPTPLT